jgi:hypothetical protein
MSRILAVTRIVLGPAVWPQEIPWKIQPLTYVLENARVAVAVIPPPSQKEKVMTFADLCLFLGILIAFATLVVKVIEVARKE